MNFFLGAGADEGPEVPAKIDAAPKLPDDPPPDDEEALAADTESVVAVERRSSLTLETMFLPEGERVTAGCGAVSPATVERTLLVELGAELLLEEDVEMTLRARMEEEPGEEGEEVPTDLVRSPVPPDDV